MMENKWEDVFAQTYISEGLLANFNCGHMQGWDGFVKILCKNLRCSLLEDCHKDKTMGFNFISIEFEQCIKVIQQTESKIAHFLCFLIFCTNENNLPTEKGKSNLLL